MASYRGKIMGWAPNALNREGRTPSQFALLWLLKGSYWFCPPSFISPFFLGHNFHLPLCQGRIFFAAISALRDNLSGILTGFEHLRCKQGRSTFLIYVFPGGWGIGRGGGSYQVSGMLFRQVFLGGISESASVSDTVGYEGLFGRCGVHKLEITTKITGFGSWQPPNHSNCFAVHPHLQEVM